MALFAHIDSHMTRCVPYMPDSALATVGAVTTDTVDVKLGQVFLSLGPSRLLNGAPMAEMGEANLGNFLLFFSKNVSGGILGFELFPNG